MTGYPGILCLPVTNNNNLHARECMTLSLPSLADVRACRAVAEASGISGVSLRYGLAPAHKDLGYRGRAAHVPNRAGPYDGPADRVGWRHRSQ
jgi:hypothetical protein